MAITRLSIDGYGARRTGSFSGKPETEVVVVAEQRTISGGGRVIGYSPETPKKKRTVKVQWTDEHDKELIRRLRSIDDEYEKKRRLQLDELLNILRNAIHLGTQVSFSGFNYLTPEDINKAKRKVQVEEENTIILALIR